MASHQEKALAPETPRPPQRCAALEKLANVLVVIASISLVAMMLHIVLDVVLKYTLNRPIQGTLEVVSFYYMVLSVFLPLALVDLRREAIAVDVFFNLFPRPLKLVCVVVALALTAVTLGAMGVRSGLDAMHAWSIGDVAMGIAAVVIWPSRFALPLGYFAAALVALWQLLGVLRGDQRESWLLSHDAAAEQ